MVKNRRGWRTYFAFGVLAGFLLSFAAPSSAQCEADGDVEFLCGPISPEDLVQIPDTPWVIVASWEADGYLSAANANSHETLRLFPSPNANLQHDASVYKECSDSISDNFQAHGMSLRTAKEDDTHTLYVVRHGAREAIEVFDVNSLNSPSLTWVGCVVAPEGVRMNSVVPLPDGGFGVTSPISGDMWEWHAAAGWSRVPGSEDIGPNGLEVTADSEWYYVAGYAAQSLLRLSRGQMPVQKQVVANVGFNIDNIHWSPDGEIFAAGHSTPTRTRIGECIKGINCEGIVSHVAKVNTETGNWQEIFTYPSNDYLRLGTVAIQVGDELWIGSVAGSTRIARIPAP
tara:strand:- start:13451 stop:14479 length:1029 start_codon:yes stop_codon:yes gene_type:complete